MSYDVLFCIQNEDRKNAYVETIDPNNWARECAELYGDFYDLCGRQYSEFIDDLRYEVGKKNDNEEDEPSFFITVGVLRKIAKAIEDYHATEGAKKYDMYAEVFGVTDFHIYDPEVPEIFLAALHENDACVNEQICWITIQQAFEMKKALLSAGNFMESIWDYLRLENNYTGLDDLSKVLKEVFADAPDDELVLIRESY